MYKKITKYILIIAIIVIIVSSLIIVYSFANKNNEIDVYDKIEKEIDYLDKEIVSIMQDLNNLDKQYIIIDEEPSDTSKANSQGSQNGSNDSNSNGSSGQSSDNSQQENQSENTETAENSSNTNQKQTTSTAKTESILLRDRNKVNWDDILSEVEQINDSWNIIIIDFNSVNIKNDDILKFNQNIDNAIKFVKAKDKTNSLISLANMYALLPQYVQQYSENTKKVEALYIKSDILFSYSIIEKNDWDTIGKYLADANNRMKQLITDEPDNQNYKKVYVLLNNYTKSTSEKDIDISYMKFYYLIDEAENLK